MKKIPLFAFLLLTLVSHAAPLKIGWANADVSTDKLIYLQGLDYRRVQFTPDVLPSDLVGFSMYDRSG
ncbi:MAG: AAA family ATPase, partial [Lentisphaeria bacterium]|nr:AAA family ATPase [Lentisphaeria bacterium]